MLKRLFTSNARIKLLSLFFSNPEKEYFIRELTRLLDEQINSVRRELDNLKEAGVLKSKVNNRKKYYLLNKKFTFYDELNSIFTKSSQDHSAIAKGIQKCGVIEYLALAGTLTGRDTPVDILIVGEIEKNKLEEFLNNDVQTKEALRYSIMTKDDFIYRWKFKDKFIHDIVEDEKTIIAVNTLQKLLK